MGFRWKVPPSQGWSASRLAQHVRGNAWIILTAWAPILESEAKENAPWTDRTSNARQTLETEVYQKTEGSIALVLRGRMHYQIFLELKQRGMSILSPELSQAGKYAVILPTVEANQGEIYQDIVEAMKR